MHLNDVHCHLFSSGFLELLTRDLPGFPTEGRVEAVARRLGWEDPGTPPHLADRWVAELDRHGVSRAALIASIPGDEASVDEVVQRHPTRFVRFFMFNPAAGDVAPRLSHAFGSLGLRAVCLHPAMHSICLDSSSSNGWMKYYPNLTPTDVFRQALGVVGPGRLVFGTDSSFFPRGWQQPVFAAQQSALAAIGTGEADQQKIFADNFDRLFADR